MSMEEYAGRALGYVRMLKNLPGKYGDARDAYAAQTDVNKEDPPGIGAVCWYATLPHGNCAMSVGDGKVVTVTNHGTVVLRPVTDPSLGRYLGWTRTII